MKRQINVKFDCVECGYPLFTYDGKQTIPIVRRCPACFSFMKFDPNTINVTKVDKVERTCASGARFY